MNNVTVKKHIIFSFIMGLLSFPFVLIMIEIKEYDMVLIAPIWLIFWWSSPAIYINSADMSINETNDIITLRTVFYEKEIPLNELEIRGHVSFPRRGGFIFYTNSKKIILPYTKNNYNTIVNVLNIKKYRHIDQFIADAAEQAKWMEIMGRTE
jgi:hypothetical protein